MALGKSSEVLIVIGFIAMTLDSRVMIAVSNSPIPRDPYQPQSPHFTFHWRSVISFRPE